MPPVVLVIALALVPVFASAFYTDLVAKIMIYSIFALSLELLVGTTGLVCFGHAAFFGVAAYAAALLSPQYESANLLWLLPAALGAAALYALAVGAFSLRTSGVYFIMVTLAFAQMAYYVFHDTRFGGGSDGIYLNVKPVLRLGETALLDLGQPLAFYGAVLACLVATYAFLSVLLRSRFGRALDGIRVNEQRMRASGFSTYPYKLAAFTLAGALAGLSGFLYAVKDGFVNPEILAWHQSGAVLLMIILGGVGSLRGAVLGAFAFTMLQEAFQSQALFGDFAKHWQLMLGGAIIACVALMPRGLIGLPAAIAARLDKRRPIGEAGASDGR